MAASGRGRPGGGISPVRNFVTIFSHCCALSATGYMSGLSSGSPAVFSLLLWHVTQYLLSVSFVGIAGVARPTAGVAVCEARAFT